MDDDETLATILAYIYVILMIFVILQLARIIYYRHLILSFQGAFLCICLIWTALRIVFWFFVRDGWPIWLSDLVYVLPTVCECATFSLLILFYAKLVDLHKWKYIRANLITVYVLANSTMLTLTIMFAGIHSNRRQNEDGAASMRFLTRSYFVSTSIYFGALSILALYYIIRLFKMTSHTAEVRKSMKTVFVTSLVFLIFLSRSIFDLLSAIRVIHVMQIKQGQHHNTKALSPLGFVCFLVWEILPTLMVLIYFSTIPSTQVAMFAAFRWHIRKFFRKCFKCNFFMNDNTSESGSRIHAYSYDSEDTISPVLGKIRVYSNLTPVVESFESISHDSLLHDNSVSASRPIHTTSTTTQNNNVFNNPHRYSLSPGEDDNWTSSSSYVATPNTRFVENLSSHYDITPQRKLPSPF